MKNNVSTLVCAALAGAALFAPLSANAQNLLLNNANYEAGGNRFVDGGPYTNAAIVAGWVGTAGPSPNLNSFTGVGSDQPFSGKELLRFGYVRNASQETNAANRAIVTPGASYDLSFLARYDTQGVNAATFSIAWYANNTAGNYTPISTADLAVSTGASAVFLPFSLTATAPAGATFAAARYASAGSFLGDAFVLSASAPAVVPEAGTLPLVLGAFATLGAGIMVRRRK